MSARHSFLIAIFRAGCLTAQLGEAPEDFFVDSITSQSFLRQALRVISQLQVASVFFDVDHSGAESLRKY